MPRNPPVYQCDRGHMLCNECHGKLNNCPVCRVPLGKTRSLITEKVKNVFAWPVFQNLTLSILLILLDSIKNKLTKFPSFIYTYD